MKKPAVILCGLLGALFIIGGAFAGEIPGKSRIDIIYTGNTWGYLRACPS